MSKYKKYQWMLLLVLVSIVAGGSLDLINDLYFTDQIAFRNLAT